ncbi:hypothetical protein NDU88_003434 [Pleurodeles waltl]|uniref:Uncharacterized protein n=1 Tax=Pleurodeles waltl TaxID=8319 RepID=A0AAV7M5A3_PLEWA|nr:hypothetical protein NDU88_003434 [Pleurodeles waltl]
MPKMPCEGFGRPVCNEEMSCAASMKEIEPALEKINPPGCPATQLPLRNGAVRANSVSGNHDDRGAGVNNTHPYFRGQGSVKRENGQDEREDGGERGRLATDRNPEKNDPEQPRAELENPDSVKDAEGRRNEEPSKDALRTRHVPGGATSRDTAEDLRQSSRELRKGQRENTDRDNTKIL